jgi:hypothetical protein
MKTIKIITKEGSERGNARSEAFQVNQGFFPDYYFLGGIAEFSKMLHGEPEGRWDEISRSQLVVMHLPE